MSLSILEKLGIIFVSCVFATGLMKALEQVTSNLEFVGVFTGATLITIQWAIEDIVKTRRSQR